MAGSARSSTESGECPLLLRSRVLRRRGRIFAPRDDLTVVHIDVSEVFAGQTAQFALEDLPMLVGGVARCVEARAWCALVLWEKPLEAVVTAFDAEGEPS